MTALAPLTFVDVETTGLHADLHQVWEIAVIRRDPDGAQVEYLWQIRPGEAHLEVVADPESLRIGRYWERAAVADGAEAVALHPSRLADPAWRLTLPELLHDLQGALDEAVVIGSNPGFDLAFLGVLLRENRRSLPWHYRPVDIATLAAGYLVGVGRGAEVRVPHSSRQLSRAVGVEPPGDGVAHTALGDARWAMAVYDAVTGGAA